ncbi:hypothetical protein HAZT_HAZT004006 [Hyalella azteca]|uniref:Uncharacterized protein n=1 Tax=Hyalella azteca TaxID=294128 RepID=A0A6A0GRY8_HYAAZ|nr:hypothetical protein HAZT_HAZT004006 [Hyalella azteca]
MYYGWYHTEHLHFHATKLYGHYGHPVAQAMTAEKYLHGKGVEKNHTLAMEWYKKAALQGHPHASYNLAVGHLQGMDVGLKPGYVNNGSVRILISFLHRIGQNQGLHVIQGVIEAADVLLKACSKGRCDD